MQEPTTAAPWVATTHPPIPLINDTCVACGLFTLDARLSSFSMSYTLPPLRWRCAHDNEEELMRLHTSCQPNITLRPTLGSEQVQSPSVGSNGAFKLALLACVIVCVKNCSCADLVRRLYEHNNQHQRSCGIWPTSIPLRNCLTS
jgi:hypothetical protein